MIPRNNHRLKQITLIYTAFLLIWFGLWLTIGDGFWWLTLLNRLVPYLFVPAPVLILPALLNRQRWLILALLIPAALFIFLYQPYLIPRPTQAQAGEAAGLKVMTYNVLFSNSNYQAVANVILTYQPDLVALQEVQPEMIDELVKRLADAYPYHLMGHHNQYGTTAAFSRHPLRDAYVLDLQADRPAVVLKVDVEGREITFISAHLLAYGLWWVPWLDIPATVNLRTFNQNRQAQLILEEIQKAAGPVIVACDCNSKETSSSYRLLNGYLTNAARQVGWVINQRSLPGAASDTNLQHIDYVFYRGALTPDGVYTIQDSGGSDHLPVLTFFVTTQPYSK